MAVAQGPDLDKGGESSSTTVAQEAESGKQTAELDDFGLPIKKRPVVVPILDTEEKSVEGTGSAEDAKPLESEIDSHRTASLEAAETTPEATKIQPQASEDGKEEHEDAESKSHEESTAPAKVDPEREGQKEGNMASVTTSNSANAVPGKLETEDIKAKNAIENTAPIETSTAAGHRRGQSSKGQGISEWSHQQAALGNAEEDQEEEDDEWQTMPAYAPYDIYDDDNKLIARERHDSDEEGDVYAGLGGAGKGYTRVQLDEDAQSATSLDEDTKYLFKDVGGTGAGEMDDEDPRDVVSQMQATKDLLTESQRVAYVGMTRLIVSAMINEVDSLYVNKGSKKELKQAVEAMRMWGQKMMVRLYAHMDINPAEQIMVEQLADHGVVPKDLTPTLMQNARVRNPMAESRPSYTSSAHSSFRFSETPSEFNGRFPSPGPDEDPAQPPPPYQDHEGDDLPEVRTPSQLPETKNIDIDLRWTVLCDLFLTLIADSVYDSRSRTLLERVGDNMDISWLEICRFEKRVTDALEMQQAAEKENWNEDDHKENRRKKALKKRYVMMGLATVGGGLVIGLSAGLLAPVIGAGLAAGFTTIGIAGTSGFLAGTGGAAIITSTAAASGGFIAIKAANRRTGAVKTFEYRPLHNNKRVNLIVTVSGWMTGKVDDVRLPYSTVDPIMGDIYSVLWEPEMLTSMGDTINILATEALTQGLQQLLGSTILVGLMAALQLPVVLTKLAYLIDNPWTVSLDRANMAGLILADSLIDRNLGTRPITFVGYSLGSRVIFSCLRELARKGAYGLVQNVYLFGSPIVAKKDEYLRAKSVVAGRFVNGYARNDWILGYLFRLTSGGISRIAGLAPVDGIPGLENIDVTEFVPGHMAYRQAMPRLLREVGWVVESDEFTEIEDPDPENHTERQRELINEIEEARKEFAKQEKEKEAKGKFGFFSRKKKTAVEKKEWETYEESKTQPKMKTEDAEGNNHGVLFDIDAIRAELASEQLDIKELKSTLPPMKLKVEGSSSSSFLRSQSWDERAQDANLKPQAQHERKSSSASPRPSLPEIPKSSPSPQYYYEEEDEVQMTFDYDEPSHKSQSSYSTRNPFSTSTSSQPNPPIAEPTERSAAVQRPELKSSLTEPTALPSTANLGHNAWADEYDDEDFGQEKEISMTFA